MDTVHRHEMGCRTIRTRGEDFEKLQRKSAKIERIKAQTVEIATKPDLESRKRERKRERESAVLMQSRTIEMSTQRSAAATTTKNSTNKGTTSTKIADRTKGKGTTATRSA